MWLKRRFLFQLKTTLASSWSCVTALTTELSDTGVTRGKCREDVGPRCWKTFGCCVVVVAKEGKAPLQRCLFAALLSSLSVDTKPFPTEPGLAFPQHTFYFIEGFRDEGLDGFEAFHYKPQRWELAAAIADQLIC